MFRSLDVYKIFRQAYQVSSRYTQRIGEVKLILTAQICNYLTSNYYSWKELAATIHNSRTERQA